MANTLPNTAGAAKLYLNEKFADVYFVFNVDGETQKIPANKVVLAVVSPVFETMFFGSLPESKDVQIVDASPEAFKEFLQFFYLDKVKLTIENIEAVARLADKYDILDCVGACAAFVERQLTLEKMCWGYQFAIFLKNDKLSKFCERNISGSPKEIFASDGFRRCDGETLGRILRLNLSCSETDVFDACVEWGKNACKEDGLDETRLENVKAQLGENFKAIRFGDMSFGTFIKIHTAYKDLFTPEEFQDIMLQITNTEYEPKMFKRVPRSLIWDNAKALRCIRESRSNHNSYNGYSSNNSNTRNVQSVEIVSFSSNQPVLLGQIWSAITKYNGYPHSGGNQVDLAIIEHDNTSHSNVFSKKLYNGAFNLPYNNNQLQISLPKPILIKPQFVYEIQVTLLNCTLALTYDNTTFIPKVKLNNGPEIDFHRNPTLGYDNVSTGWISTLLFNKV